VVAPAPSVGHGIPRIADHRIRSELSAFLVIVCYTYRNKSALKFSVLIRTIAGEATVYFLVMIAAQIYIQLSLSLMEVCTHALSLVSCSISRSLIRECFRVSGDRFRSCEFAINLNNDSSQLTVPTHV